ncbi:MAG: lysine--tRNA ligase [Candidatus Uhrbacteria bacterium]
MGDMQDEYHVRLGKMETLRKKGVLPYPSACERDTRIGDAVEQFEAWSAAGRNITLAGRLLLIRVHGKMIFADLRDATGTIQLQFTVDRQGEDAFEEFEKNIDPGDFLQAAGTLFLTKKGQKTLAVSEWKLLTKTLRPLPEKWHGLKDVEIRYRERELDLLANEDVLRVFRTRTALVRTLRDILDREGFEEIETPVLQSIAGGATARPFVTHHHALDHDFYLRIAPELYLKRCIVGGFEKVYELGRQFRNEGIDWSHNPEFTSLEFYWAYEDYESLMNFTERFLPEAVETVLGTTSIRFQGEDIQFAAPWPRMTFAEAIKQSCGIDILGIEKEALIRRMQELRIDCDYAGADLGKLYDELYKETVRKKQIQPIFITRYPIEMEPLAKRCDDDPRFVQRFQLIAGGLELLKAYTELNDPVDQRNRFLAQQELAEAGDDEAQRIDEQFLKALEHGMPPTAGWGMGIDRFVMMLTDQKSMKDVILFPTLKPRESSADGENEGMAKSSE